jgi:aminobenzoyl-glutamate utilization protein B
MRPCPRRPAILKALVILTILSAPWSGAPAAESRARQKVLDSVEAQRADLVRLSEQIWGWAETALRETRSAAAVAEYAERHGFRVERGVAGMPTAFVATFGAGRPIIGVLGEYDALPGISQKAQPTREPLQPGAGGHGCGHNLFGPASLGAAIAVKDRIAAGDLKGTVRFYGTPAEEARAGRSTWRAKACSTISTSPSPGTWRTGPRPTSTAARRWSTCWRSSGA